ncbi:MAG: ThuA domain-containing protein [Planctomycetota bacterium]|nr:ThuA domain-containing protein [Planctomycetota bacterium]
MRFRSAGKAMSGATMCSCWLLMTGTIGMHLSATEHQNSSGSLIRGTSCLQSVEEDCGNPEALQSGAADNAGLRQRRPAELHFKEKKQVVLVAGSASHRFGEHEHYAGCRLLADRINRNVPGLHAMVSRDGWPEDPTAFDHADAIIFYCDGGSGHPVNDHLQTVREWIPSGVGLGAIHYAVEVPKGEPGSLFLTGWGGYFETFWSVNPHWKALIKRLPTHPLTRGVRPFSIQDEWYYHMRFRPQMEGLVPILIATPPESTRLRGIGARGSNEHVRERTGVAEYLMWAYQRAGGGRGFGFTGGHVHWNWAHDSYRKLVLNAIVWTAGMEVPEEGIPSETPSLEELIRYQDEPVPEGFDFSQIERLLQGWPR